jgi:hypothetical protein
VSLDYALEHMQRSAPGFGPPADTFLKRIRDRRPRCAAGHLDHARLLRHDAERRHRRTIRRGHRRRPGGQPVIRGTVNMPSASSAVPGYTTTPPETAYYGQPNLSGAANARLSTCATSINDPVCQAQAAR